MTVHQRLGDGNERNSIRNAMVDPHQQGRPSTVVIYQVQPPQRVFAIEGLRGQLRQTVLQRLLRLPFGMPREPFNDQVMIQVEVRVFYPVGTCGVFHHALYKPRILQQALLQALTQRGMGNAWTQHPNAHDHHQVVVGIHAQPCGIYPPHALTFESE